MRSFKTQFQRLQNSSATMMKRQILLRKDFITAFMNTLRIRKICLGISGWLVTWLAITNIINGSEI